MTEYKSLYINKTWDEITTSFDWVNCQPIILVLSDGEKQIKKIYKAIKKI
ncbi:hypothetical protein [Spiroplasma phoeniceum]|nr:hypothetical protein [Spiroplasma phoeniceum]